MVDDVVVGLVSFVQTVVLSDECDFGISTDRNDFFVFTFVGALAESVFVSESMLRELNTSSSYFGTISSLGSGSILFGIVWLMLAAGIVVWSVGGIDSEERFVFFFFFCC